MIEESNTCQHQFGLLKNLLTMGIDNNMINVYMRTHRIGELGALLAIITLVVITVGTAIGASQKTTTESRAQSASCPFYATAEVRKDSATGPLLSTGDMSGNKPWYTINTKNFQIFFDTDAKITYGHDDENLNGGSVFGYKRGERAEVTLVGPRLTNRWEVTGTFCTDDSGHTVKGCPGYDQGATAQFKDFLVDCGVRITYGWIVKEKGSAPTPTASQDPTSTPEPIVTTAPTPTGTSVNVCTGPKPDGQGGFCQTACESADQTVAPNGKKGCTSGKVCCVNKTPQPTSVVPTRSAKNTPTPKPRPKPTSKLTPTKKPYPGFVTIKSSDIKLSWNFVDSLQPVTGVDRSIHTLKVGICDMEDRSFYTQIPVKYGGTGPNCRWTFTVGGYGTPIEKADTPKGTTTLLEDITVDSDGNMLVANKDYYITCQYYVVKGIDILKGQYGGDEWRRCDPRPWNSSMKDPITFENILSIPQNAFDVPQQTALLTGGRTNPLIKVGDPFIGITLAERNDGAFGSTGLEYLPNFRPGICPVDAREDSELCTFFDPITGPDPAGTAPQFTTKYIFSVGYDGEKLVPGKRYKVTCQYFNTNKVGPTVSRCDPKIVEVKAKYVENMTAFARPWNNISSESYHYMEASDGFVPLSLSVDSTQPGLTAESATYTICETDSSTCSRKTVPVTNGMAKEKFEKIAEQAIDPATEYEVTCSLSLSDGSTASCGTKALRSGDMIFFNSTVTSADTVNNTVANGVEKCDINNDKACNSIDIASCLSSGYGDATTNNKCDITGDKKMAADDLSIFYSQFGKSIIQK